MTYAHAVAIPEQAPSRDAGRAPRPHSPARLEARTPGMRHELDRFAARALEGPGEAVASGLRAEAERVTGADLSGVRLHIGPRARAAGRAAGASAFTVGRDVALAVGQGRPLPERLVAHELVHVAQQTQPGSASPDQAERQARAVDAGFHAGAGLAGEDVLGTGVQYIAFAATDWLQSTPNVRDYGYSALLEELTEVDEWISRQVASTPETDRMEDAKEALTAEIARRQGAMAAQDGPRPRRRGRRGRQAAAEPELPPQTEMPRILREQTSTQTTDPAEIRAEVDRITSWLQRPDLSRDDRAILRQELGSLAPGLQADLAQASSERRQARLARALSPSSSGDRAGVVANLRTIDSIRPYQEQPGMAYVMHEGELLVFPQEVADRVRAQALAALAEAARQARDLNESSTYRMGEHLRLNYEEQPYVGFVVSVFNGEEPVELQSRMLDPLSDSNVALSRFRNAQQRGSLADMGDAVFTAVEKAGQANQIVRDGIEAAINTAGGIVEGLTITRNLSFAIALSIGAIVAAPLVAAGVAGTGATGLLATGMTAVGTSGVVGVGGYTLGFGSGAGGELLAGNGADRALEAGLAEGSRVGTQGALIGLGGGASLGLARNLGVGAEGLTFGQNLWRGMAAQGGGGALSGTAGGLLQEPPEGSSRGDMALRGGLTGLGFGLFGGAAGTYSQTLTSPGAQFAVGVGAPSLAAGGVTYAQTGDLSQSLQAGAVALAVGTLGRARANQQGQNGPQRSFRLDARGHPGAEARLYRMGQSLGNTTRAYGLAAGLGLFSAAPAFRMGQSGGGYNLTDPRTPSGYVARPTTQTAATQTAAQPAPAQAAPAQAAPAAAPAQASAPPATPAPPTAAAVRISSGAFLVNPARLVADPFSGAVLGQRSASAQTDRSVITGPRADEAEAAGWREALRRGEIGLQAPLGANVRGGDFFTARVDANGQVTLIATDVKMSTIGQFPAPATTLRPAWRAELQAAIQPGRLNLGDPALEAAIRAAFAAGRVQLRQLNADYSPSGGGSITGF